MNSRLSSFLLILASLFIGSISLVLPRQTFRQLCPSFKPTLPHSGGTPATPPKLGSLRSSGLYSSGSNSANMGSNDKGINLNAVDALRSIPPPSGFSAEEAPIPLVPEAYIGSGVATAVAWIIVSFVVLLQQPHPGTYLSTLTWHNTLTMAQALALPLPLLAGVILTLQKAARHGWQRLEQAPFRRINVGFLSLSLYLTFVVRNFGTFAFGYADLLPSTLAKKLGLIHMLSAGVTWGVWKASVKAEGFWETPRRLFTGIVESFWKIAPSLSSSSSALSSPYSSSSLASTVSLYAMATVLMGGLTLLPLATPYPTATVPSMLDKQLCRAVVAFYGLATTAAFVLKQEAEEPDAVQNARRTSLEPLRKGLGIASATHLALLGMKLLGVDGGGWWIPGTGLRDNYPAMVATPFWTALSMLAHLVTVCATWTGGAAKGGKDVVRVDNDTGPSVVDAEIVT